MRENDKTQLRLKGRWEEIPCDKAGDPCFTTFEQVRTVFTDEEIVLLVNRQLYSLNYQREVHAKLYAHKKDAKTHARSLKLNELLSDPNDNEDKEIK